jgi:hypothetical protein
MPGVEDTHPSPFAPLQAELARMRRANLTTAIDDVDRIIDLLEAARESIAGGMEVHGIPMRGLGVRPYHAYTQS